MIDLFQNVLGGVTGGLLGERVKRHLDRLSNPVAGPPPTGSNEILESIRDLLYAAAGSVKPPLHRLRQNIKLQAFPDVAYIVTYEGRPHFNILCGSSFLLYVESTIGRFSVLLGQGWNNLDLADGARLYVPVGASSQDVIMEYSNYIHGNPIPASGLSAAAFDQTNELRTSLYGKNVAAGDTALVAESTGRLQVQLLSTVQVSDAQAVFQQRTEGGSQNSSMAVGPVLFNGAGWDRQRANTDLTLLASAARTTTTASPDQINYNGRGVVVFLNITAVPGVDTLQVNVQAKDPVSGVYSTFAQGPTIATTGFQYITVYPGAATAGSFLAYTSVQPLPRTWRVNIGHSAATSFTYSVGASVIL